MNGPVLIAVAASMLLATVPGESRELANYPEKPIKLVIPSTAGSPPDLIGRVIGEKLAAALGQALVFENRPGATGLIGLEVVAKAAPDGYTLGVMSMPHLIMTTLLKTVPYDIEKDLAPVSLMTWHYSILAVRDSSRFRSVADLIELARERPGAMKYSSGGNATPGHVASALFGRDAGIVLTHVPYRGSPDAVIGLLSGEVDFSIAATGAVSRYLKPGELRPLATTAPHRIAAYPELRTFAELGYPTVEIQDWQGIVAPAGTPGDIIDRLYEETSKAIAMPDVRRRLEALGMEIANLGPSQFRGHIHEDRLRWSKLVRDGLLQVE